MKFQYLGTAAAEGWPALICDCEACGKALAAGGRNIRTRSQAIVDDRLLIDFPADTYHHMIQHGVDLGKVHHCIITHDHMDHFHPEDLEMRRKGFAHPAMENPLILYGTPPTERKIRARIDMTSLERDDRLGFQPLVPFVTLNIDGYQVTPLKADHDPKCEPVFYLVGDGLRHLLYANDTGWFPDETWAYLEKEKPMLDFVSLDCTFIILEGRNSHMNLEACREAKERLLKIGCANMETRFCLHHFSHNGLIIYDELVPLAKQAGFDVSYDGMTVMI